MADSRNGPGLPLDGSVVKMKGLPFKASGADVTRFFQGFILREEDIYLKRHPDGRPNGEAFIIFENAEEARKATQKDRETFGEKFGDRYVRVYPTLDSDIADMQAAVVQHSQSGPMGSGHHPGHCDSVVKIKSLPFDGTQLDIITFFDAFKLKPNGVQLVVRSDNRATGEAFVDFESPEEAGRAIRERDHKVFSEKFGDRYVRLIQVSRKEMQATLALRFGGEGILKMKGIPFKATPQDVRKFFGGFRIKPEGISFIMHGDGRPTGMAFIEFDTPQEAVRAMDKDRAKFGPEYGDRFCMLQLVGRHEMDKVALQKESDNSTQKLLAAALATQAALQNPALSLQPMLMGGTNPYMLHLGAYGGGRAANGANGMLDASALAAASHQQYTAQLATQGMTSLLQQQQQQAAAQQLAQQQAAQQQAAQLAAQQAAAQLLAVQQQAAQQAAMNAGLDHSSSWVDSLHGDAESASPDMFYQNHAHQLAGVADWMMRASADGRSPGHGAGMTLGNGGGMLWGGAGETNDPDYDARVRQRSASYSGTGNGRGGMHLNFNVPGGVADFSSLKAAVGAALAGSPGGGIGW